MKTFDQMREGGFGRPPWARALLLLVFFLAFFGAWAIVSDMAVSFHVSLFYGRGDAVAPILLLTLLISIPFLFVKFSFGYFVGFYLFVMMSGYFWVNRFGTLGYDRSAGLASAAASIILFLIPALLLTIPAKRSFSLPHKVLDALPVCILVLSAFVLVAAAFDGFRFVSLADMYKHREQISHSRAVNYAIGILDGALLPFAFACALSRKRWLVLALLCGAALLLYATAFTKLSLLVPFYLIFIAALTRFFEARSVVILSLLIPVTVGLIARALDTEITNAVFGFLLLRLLAIPSISLDHYFVFFADHPVTHFCQITPIRRLVDCPYPELGVALSNWFGLGNQNASLFATEGVASVGPMLAPLVAFLCGGVIAIGNMVSAGLPKRFILISACMMPQILLNVPLSTTFLSHGMGVLFALLYLTPRDYFDRLPEHRLAHGPSGSNEPAQDAAGKTARMTTQKPKILLSEGSSLSSREAITALGLAGHRVELLSSNPICLGRFSRFVARVHQAPASGADPDGYLAAAIEAVRTHGVDALIPVHEQAYLFAAAREQLPAGLGIALADFEAFEQVQSKASFAALLTQLKVPQPATDIVRSADEFATERRYPFFVKAAFGTASAGVWRVGDMRQRDALLVQLERQNGFAEGLLVQAVVIGALERTQAVFDHGRLVASHIYRQVVEGPGGGDVLKISVNRAEVRSTVERIGQALTWHGALSFDYILDDATQTAHFIDANPRLVEPMNAWLSGVDLPGALLQVSLGEKPPTQPEGREGVLTRLGLMGLLDAARQRDRRRDILREIGRLASGSGRYRGSREELAPLLKDPWCAIPMGVVAARLLYTPEAAARFSDTTVAAYSLTPSAIHRLRAWRHAA